MREKRKERRETKKTPKQFFLVLKFPSPLALPLVEINTYLVNDNLANCQALRGSAQTYSVCRDGGFLFLRLSK